MCRLCLPNTTLEQHFKYFQESGYSPQDIVDLVIKSHYQKNKVNKEITHPKHTYNYEIRIK
jgi:hypothetical protein